MIRFKQRLLPNCLLHDLEILAVNGVEHKPIPLTARGCQVCREVGKN